MMTLPGSDASSECLGWPQVLAGEYGETMTPSESGKNETPRQARVWDPTFSAQGRHADLLHEACKGTPPASGLTVPGKLPVTGIFLRSASDASSTKS